MLTAPQNLAAALTAVRARIASAAARSGRDASAVTLIGVVKGQSAAAVSEAVSLGLVDLAENYAQEALARQDAIAEPRVVWHFIGALQGNKTRIVADRFAWVHTVDRFRIARRLSEQRSPHGAPLNVCLQVNLGAETSKAGIDPGGVLELAVEVSKLERLRLRGLMCIPPVEASPEGSRRWFRQLWSIREMLRDAGLSLDTLSMGMSDDFEVAVEEGATHVRVGTALFGSRG